MDVKCCKCKKEYDLASNIFEYKKDTNCPILICPYCGFKHIINFMPFEKQIKVKKVEKLDLTVLYVNLGASRIATATRVIVSDDDDADVKDGIAWDISTFVYEKSKNVESQDGSANDVFFKSDGLTMYVMGLSTDTIYQYTLSIAWDVTTATYSKLGYVGGTATAPATITFSTDGTKVYVMSINTAAETIFQFTLNIAWDISTIVYANKSFLFTELGEPDGIFLHPDGTYMYVVTSYPSDTVYQLELSTPWDISTASEYQEFDTTDGDITPNNLFFKSDGLKMYILGLGEDRIYQYTLSSAWDITSASYTGKYKGIETQDITNYGVFIRPDGGMMYHIGRYGEGFVYQYKLSEAWVKTNDFILATRIYTSKGPIARAYKLRWRDVTDEGIFADVTDTGEITCSAVTDLVDGDDLLIEEKLCAAQSGYTWQNGLESEGDNLLPDSGTYSLADEYYTEFQWALDCSNAEDEHEYEFELWDVTEGVSVGTCLATITMAITIVGGLSMKWNGVAISKWNGAVINKLNGVD